MRCTTFGGILLGLLLLASAGLGCAGCGSSTPAPVAQGSGQGTSGQPASKERELKPVDTAGVKADLTGKIQIDGSSTVYKISQLAAEEFSGVAKNVDISVGFVGTGGGFKNFPDPAKELDVCDASRPIQEKELQASVANGVKFLELPIGIDAITIVVSANSDLFKDHITLDELKLLWAPGESGKGDVTKWSQIRKDLPDEAVALYGADTASGTFEYFNEAVHKDKKKTRTDYTANANDNVLIQGVEKNKFALGYIPYAYYAPRTSTLRAVKIKVADGSDAVEPKPETISTGAYHPFARPLFIYVNTQSLERPEVANFVQFYLHNAGPLCHNAGYIPFNDVPPIYPRVVERFEKREIGTAFGGKLDDDLDMTTLMDLPVSYPQQPPASN